MEDQVHPHISSYPPAHSTTPSPPDLLLFLNPHATVKPCGLASKPPCAVQLANPGLQTTGKKVSSSKAALVQVCILTLHLPYPPTMPKTEALYRDNTEIR